MTELIIRCSCGTLQGVAHGVSGKSGNHCVCYCDDCQQFAQFLGRAEEILDANGGTEIFQMSPAQLEFTSGLEHLACMRLSPGGLLRWYADCCNTPLGNTLISPAIPMVGLILACIDFADGLSADEVLGPVLARVQGRFASGDTRGLDIHDKTPVRFLLRFLRLVMKWRIQGAGRRSPLHDADSGEPVRVPLILSKQERQALGR